MDAIDYAKSYKPTGSPVQEVNDPLLKDSGIRLLIKRDDLIHEHISGNKWRKLKYNIREAVQQNHHTILTFGGAYSNHIAATAFACKKAGMESIGIIRGEDDPSNPTLQFARENDMRLEFVSRMDYRNLTRVGACRGTPENIRFYNEDNDADRTCHGTPLQQQFGRFFLIPEGGANGLGVRGCAEILSEIEEQFDVVCCAAGTGTTLAGLAVSLSVGACRGTPLLGFPALKGGDFLMKDVERLMAESRLGVLGGDGRAYFHTPLLITDYHFGGYAKMKPELLAFINGFTERTGIPLDPIYTGKMMFGIYDMILNRPPVGAHGNTPDRNTPDGDSFKKSVSFQRGTTILAIHTGGLQGWQGMEHRGLV